LIDSTMLGLPAILQHLLREAFLATPRLVSGMTHSIAQNDRLLFINNCKIHFQVAAVQILAVPTVASRNLD
jgi:hypothetical protein